MKGTWMKFISVAVVGMMALTGCSSTTMCKDFNGLSTPDGDPVGHLSTSNVAIHLLMNKPLKGDASLEKTVSDFTAAAKAGGASKVRIVQSGRSNYWWLFFPFTILITPVISNVSGDALK
ncbi:MAG TPA: hypothetical protein PKL97_08720 [Candidatus Omnitrophota bacterium]|nr:hypothetical protein [Candidatus Omnitrophota bacterium]